MASHPSDKHSSLYCDRISTSDLVVTEAFCSAQASPCPTARERGRESTARRGREANQMKKAHVTRQVRGERERKGKLSFSCGKCFSYKSSFLTSTPCLLLECSIFKKCLPFHVSSLSVQKGELD